MPKSRGWYTNCRGGYWYIVLRRLSYPSALTEVYGIWVWEPLHGFLFYSHAHKDYTYTEKERDDCQCLQRTDIYSNAHARGLTMQRVTTRMAMLSEDWHIQQCSRKRVHSAMSVRKNSNSSEESFQSYQIALTNPVYEMSSSDITRFHNLKINLSVNIW
jgi:hypothetical protein